MPRLTAGHKTGSSVAPASTAPPVLRTCSATTPPPPCPELFFCKCKNITVYKIVIQFVFLAELFVKFHWFFTFAFAQFIHQDNFPAVFKLIRFCKLLVNINL